MTNAIRRGPSSNPFVMGTTFWTTPKARATKSHLNIVITDPLKSREEVALVNATTLYRGDEYDASCVINPGEYPDLPHRSYIIYAYGRVVTLEQLETLRAGNMIHRPDWIMRGELLVRVQRGALASRFTPTRVVELLKAQGLV